MPGATRTIRSTASGTRRVRLEWGGVLPERSGGAAAGIAKASLVRQFRIGEESSTTEDAEDTEMEESVHRDRLLLVEYDHTQCLGD